jgi:hypothetical protein
MPRNPILLLATLLTLAALPLAAQAGTPAEATLAGRMRAFMREVGDRPNTELAAFFPRRGDWTWMHALRDPDGAAIHRIETWRFPGAETPRAIGADGPVCASFELGDGHFGPFEERFGMQARMNPGRWRRVRGNRFVPSGSSAASPVFVEWRREDGQWVVSAFGDVDIYFPHLLGRDAGPFQLDTTGVPEDAAFAQADWYTITLHGRRSPKYGLPRPIDRAQLVRVGVLDRVSVYVQRGYRWGTAEVLYLPVAPGQYQPYEWPLSRPCA